MACGFVAEKQEAQGAQKRRDAVQSYPCTLKFKHAVTRSYKRFLTVFISHLRPGVSSISVRHFSAAALTRPARLSSEKSFACGLSCDPQIWQAGPKPCSISKAPHAGHGAMRFSVSSSSRMLIFVRNSVDDFHSKRDVEFVGGERCRFRFVVVGHAHGRV